MTMLVPIFLQLTAMKLVIPGQLRDPRSYTTRHVPVWLHHFHYYRVLPRLLLYSVLLALIDTCTSKSGLLSAR
jgi:hypothetical protein